MNEAPATQTGDLKFGFPESTEKPDRHGVPPKILGHGKQGQGFPGVSHLVRLTKINRRPGLKTYDWR